MKDSLILEHKKFISAKQASVLVGYAQDYVGQLCREGKIESKMVGRTWFVSEESILNHKISNLKKSIDPRIQEILNINKVSSEQTQPYLVSQAQETDIVKTQNTSENTVSEKSTSQKVNYEKTNSDIIDQRVVELKKIRNATRILPPIYNPQITTSASIVLNKPTISLVSNSYSNDISDVNDEIDNVINLLPSKKVLMSLVMVAVIITNIFFLRNIFNSNSSAANIIANKTINKTLTVSQTSDLSASIFTKLSGISNPILSFFGFGKSSVVSNDITQLAKNDAVVNVQVNTQTNPDTSYKINPEVNQSAKFDGIAVVPSLGQSDKQEIIKNNIRNTFSDEVEVIPDKSGTSGVITPVFKKVSKDNYVYVLVPEVKKKQ